MKRIVEREDNKKGVINSLRKQPYTPAQCLAELIDNSNSARKHGQQTVNVRITITQDPKTHENILSITDDAGGFSANDFGKVIGYANSIGGGVQNEHGMGLKQAAASIGHLRKLESRDVLSKKSTYAEFQDMYAVLDPFELQTGKLSHSGTHIELVIKDGHPLLKDDAFIDCISELQTTYQKVLGRSLHIEINNTLITNTKYHGFVGLQPDAVSNHLRNAIHQNDSWFATKELEGSGPDPWKAIVKIGFLEDRGTPNLIQKLKTTPKPTDISKHQRTLENQGIAIFKGDRQVFKTKGWTLNGFNSVFDARSKTFQHNDYNGLVLEIEIDDHFSTVPTKNGLDRSPEYEELQLALNMYLRRVIPDPKSGSKNKIGMRAIPLLEYVRQWNKGNAVKADDTPTSAIPWHHKQKTLQQNWVSLKHFGMWKIWEHKGTNKVVAMHKYGINTQISPSDIPDMRAFSEHLKVETGGKVSLPIFVHNFPDMLPVDHYAYHMMPKVCTPKEAVSEIGKAQLLTPLDQNLKKFVVASSMLQTSLKEFPYKFRQTQLDKLEAEIMAP